MTTEPARAARRDWREPATHPSGGLEIRFGRNCYIRATPSAAGTVLGVAKRGNALPYGGATAPNGWLAVVYRGEIGWVSGRICG